MIEQNLKKVAKKMRKETEQFAKLLANTHNNPVSSVTNNKLTETLAPVYAYLKLIFEPPVEEEEEEEVKQDDKDAVDVLGGKIT